MKLKSVLTLAAAMSAASVSAATMATPPSLPVGVWSNPKGTVHVRMQPCGERVCGTVVWASAKAQADAKKGGTPKLIGTQLFREFKQVAPNAWSGRVFLPDMNRTFSGKMTALGPRTISGRGCLIGGLLCKSQTWRRID
jgi:uncharacterized protein (DUF2147 family)